MRRKTKNLTWSDYAEWLIKDYVCFDDWDMYKKIFLTLHNIDYYTVLSMDENRKSDGLYLRNYFNEEFQNCEIADEIYSNDCSVLEMLSAFSVRIDHEYIGELNTHGTCGLFMEMIDNLGLLKCPINKIESIVDIWLSRRFAPNGEGSIFPLSRPRRNQTLIQVWDQAMEYIFENY